MVPLSRMLRLLNAELFLLSASELSALLVAPTLSLSFLAFNFCSLYEFLLSTYEGAELTMELVRLAGAFVIRLLRLLLVLV